MAGYFDFNIEDSELESSCLPLIIKVLIKGSNRVNSDFQDLVSTLKLSDNKSKTFPSDLIVSLENTQSLYLYRLVVASICRKKPFS